MKCGFLGKKVQADTSQREGVTVKSLRVKQREGEEYSTRWEKMIFFLVRRKGIIPLPKTKRDFTSALLNSLQ